MCDERKRKKSVRDGAFEWRFFHRARFVQMDPLAILGGFSECSNSFLADDHPVGHRDFAADEFF